MNTITAPPTIAAVLFDMDGTLVDSDAAVARAWARWAATRGVDPAQVALTTKGRPARDSLADLAPWLTPAERLAETEVLLQWERDDMAEIVATRGALDLVAALDGWSVPFAVVTSADDSLAGLRLRSAGLPVPEVLITASTVRRGKPDPEGFLTAAERLGVRPATCLVVEDSPVGVQAGLAAGAIVVSVRDDPAAHLRAKGLDQLHHWSTPTGSGQLRIHPSPTLHPTSRFSSIKGKSM